jgi:hypothetical protein
MLAKAPRLIGARWAWWWSQWPHAWIGAPAGIKFVVIDAATIASKRLADETARARADANLRRAFNDLLPKLNRAYGQPARDEADARAQHVVALKAIADFLKQMGPDYLAHSADRFAKLAQALQDLDEGSRSPILTPVFVSRSDQTVVWLARSYVALAVETMQRCGHSRKSAAKWAAMRAAKRHPGLKKQLITESGPALDRGKSLETAIISWCRDFSSGKVKNHYATHVYSLGLGRLKAGAPNCDSDQIEAGRLLEEAVDLLISEFRRNKSAE